MTRLVEMARTGRKIDLSCSLYDIELLIRTGEIVDVRYFGDRILTI
jgi:hypothetical protein